MLNAAEDTRGLTAWGHTAMSHLLHGQFSMDLFDLRVHHTPLGCGISNLPGTSVANSDTASFLQL